MRIFARACLGFVFAFCVTLIASVSHAETVEQSASYVSQVDEDLTLRRVAVLPVVDNVDGIYARPVEAQLISLVKDSHRWDYVEAGVAGAMPSAGDMEENPAEVQRVTRSIEADAFIVAAVSRGPTGLSIRVDLFLKKDGKLLSQQILKDHPRFEIPEVLEQVKILYQAVVGKLPYSGLVLSRNGTRVTVNLGKSDGIQKDQTISAIQIISLTRHPKFNFIISSEKEILGKIKILKVEDTLSFGAIVAEKERGAIHKNAKISGLDLVTYPEPEGFEKQPGSTNVNGRPDAPIAFGKNPIEWIPIRPPSFGEVGINLGLGTFTNSANVTTNSVGSLQASSSFYPSISAHGELWLTPNWTVRADLTQGVISTPNPRDGSSPGTLNQSLQRYSLFVQYNFLLHNDFFGPKLFVDTGFMTYKLQVDDSTPQALTTTSFSGFALGFGGSFPINEEKIWYAGGKLNLYLMPTMSETPTHSGSGSSPTINEFSLFVEKKIAENLRATGSLDFALYTASMSGAGNRVGPSGTTESASSVSQRHSVLTGGISYMF